MAGRYRDNSWSMGAADCRWGGDLSARDIALLPMLRDVAGFERLAGTGAGRLPLDGVARLAQGAWIWAVKALITG